MTLSLIRLAKYMRHRFSLQSSSPVGKTKRKTKARLYKMDNRLIGLNALGLKDIKQDDDGAFGKTRDEQHI